MWWWCDYINLFDGSHEYMVTKGTISVVNNTAEGADANNDNKQVVFKKCALFTDCISKTNNTQIGNGK